MMTSWLKDPSLGGGGADYVAAFVSFVLIIVFTGIILGSQEVFP